MTPAPTGKKRVRLLGWPSASLYCLTCEAEIANPALLYCSLECIDEHQAQLTMIRESLRRTRAEKQRGGR